TRIFIVRLDMSFLLANGRTPSQDTTDGQPFFFNGGRRPPQRRPRTVVPEHDRHEWKCATWESIRQRWGVGRRGWWSQRPAVDGEAGGPEGLGSLKRPVNLSDQQRHNVVGTCDRNATLAQLLPKEPGSFVEQASATFVHVHALQHPQPPRGHHGR